MTRFLASGDLHLSKGLSYGRTPEERLAEQARCWQRVIQVAVERDCDAILFAGDATEHKQPSNEAEDAFLRPLAALKKYRIPVVAILGNHDGNEPGKPTMLDNLADAGLLGLYRSPGFDRVGDVTVACLPWVSTAHVRATNGGGDVDDVNEWAAALLMETARGLRAKITGPAVLLTHFAISGDIDGLSKVAREPVLDLRELEALGFDAVVAGHFHRPQLLSVGVLEPDEIGSHVVKRGAPIIYTGSPMPLDFAEAGYRHGCWILDVDSSGGRVDFVPLEPEHPFRDLTFDLELASDRQLLERLVAGNEPGLEGAIVKLTVRATEERARRIDRKAILEVLYEAGAYNVWGGVRIDVVRAERDRSERLDESLSETDAFQAWLRSAGVNGSRGAGLLAMHDAYLREVQR